ncbi:putative ankyrin repeat protein rf_0381 [Phtheirospermum japonicum]|uniref:Putative ankyrin repeat protein rf_0381 n=1 Tax=Phtheirospermum japonicum TaxID=374723 RepID=A0A830AXF9_9LAMI|nr:putative ankyrin repeat protein rf_0381 [Phtheirospermum japonicum]
MGKKAPPANASSGNEELHAAARSGDLAAVQSICGANPLAVNSRDRHSRTPLHLAAWSGHAEVASYLCKNKADIRAAAMDDMGAIHFAAQKGHLEVVKILVTSGVSVKSYNRKGMTALHYAAQGSNVELVRYLLKKGANKDSRNKAGKNAVDLAGSEEIRKLLVEFEFPSGKGNEKDEKAEMEIAGDGDEKDETLKRKNEEEIERNETGTKKSKVPLSHLLAADDDGHEEEG